MGFASGVEATGLIVFTGDFGASFTGTAFFATACFFRTGWAAGLAVFFATGFVAGFTAGFTALAGSFDAVFFATGLAAGLAAFLGAGFFVAMSFLCFFCYCHF